MFKSNFLLLSFILLISPMQAKDIDGYQKLRGAIISSQPEDAYATHACNAFDTNKGTCFKAANIQGWVGLDLKSEHVIKKIQVFPRADRTECMYGCIFQGSNDADFSCDIHTLATVTQIPEAGQYAVYDVSETTPCRYVRCYASDTNCNLAELEFYGEEGAQVIEYPQLTNLPTIYLETGGNYDFVDKSIYAASQVVVVNDGAVDVYGAQVRGRGNSTWDYMEKKPFRIKFDKKQHFLGLPANAKSWTLISLAVDKTLLRNALAFEISRFLVFEFTPSCMMVDVVLDGFYYGTFMASDHIEINENRIDIDEMDEEDTDAKKITGGYHLEIDAYASEELEYFVTPRGVPITIKSPDEDVIQPVQKEYIANHIRQLENLLFSDTEKALKDYIDVESAVKYYLLSELTGNCDSYWCISCYKKRGDDKLYFGPVWDYDQAFLTNERVPRFEATLDQEFGMARAWFQQIMQTPMAQNVLARLWKRVKDESFKPQLQDFLAENAAYLQKSQTLNFRRWNSINRKVWFEGALFDTYDEYIDFVSDFIEDRFEWFDQFPATRTALLPPSTPSLPAHAWKYTEETPADDWYAVAYDDSQWLLGDAPFGTAQNLQNTDWWTSRIFIRTQFNVDKKDLDTVERAWFYVFHDEDCQVYLNGEPALEWSGYIANYQFFEFDKTFLQEGLNTIAVQCTQTGGGQLIDVGVFASLKERIDMGIKSFRTSQQYPWLVRNGILFMDGIDDVASAVLYTMDGRQVDRQIIIDGQLQMTLPGRGIYFVRIGKTTVKIKN
jgi:hypothetical protein